jgi:hypothetical protein
MSDKEAIVKNAADPKQVAAAGGKIKLRDQAEKERIGAIMATRPGRRWVWEKLEWCKVFLPTFAVDPYRTAYSEGARLVGLEILKDVNKLDPDMYLTMAKEAQEDKERGI